MKTNKKEKKEKSKANVEKITEIGKIKKKEKKTKDKKEKKEKKEKKDKKDKKDKKEKKEKVVKVAAISLLPLNTNAPSTSPDSCPKTKDSKKRKSDAESKNISFSEPSEQSKDIRTSKKQKVQKRIPAVSPVSQNLPTSFVAVTRSRSGEYANNTGKVKLKDLPKYVDKVKLSNVDLTNDTRNLTKDSEGKLTDHEKHFNMGPFSKRERELVDAAVNELLGELDVPYSDAHLIINPQTSVRTPDEKLKYKGKQFKRFPAQVLERAQINRSIKQVYYYLRYAYSELKKDAPPLYKWTKEDDRQLLEQIELKGEGNWVQIENALARKGAKVFKIKKDRYDCLKMERRGTWTAEDNETMLKYGYEIMERQGITDPHKFNSWTELSILMKNRTYRDCARHWPLLLAKKNRKNTTKWTKDSYKDLLSRMIKLFKNANDETEGIWKKIVSSNDIWDSETCRNRWFQIKSLAEKYYLPEEYTFRRKL